MAAKRTLDSQFTDQAAKRQNVGDSFNIYTAVSEDQQLTDLWNLWAAPRDPLTWKWWKRWYDVREPSEELLQRCREASTKPSTNLISFDTACASAIAFRDIRTEAMTAIPPQHALVIEAAKRELDYLTYISCRIPKKMILVPDFHGSVYTILRLLETEKQKKTGNRKIMAMERVHNSELYNDFNKDEMINVVNSCRILPENENQVCWNDVVGMEEVKMQLTSFASKITFQHLTKNFRGGRTGHLLFGPQGTGKTTVVKSFAAHQKLLLYDIPISKILSKYVGDGEKFITTMFDVIKQNSPAVLLIDEIDGLFREPNDTSVASLHTIQAELKKKWSDIMATNEKILIIGATNKPWKIDLDGFGRRFSSKSYVGLPTRQGLMEIFSRVLININHRLTPSMVKCLAHLAHQKGLTGADVEMLVEKGIEVAIGRITSSHFFKRVEWKEMSYWAPCSESDPDGEKRDYESFSDIKALCYTAVRLPELYKVVKETTPSVNKDMLKKHEEWAMTQGIKI
ncbi:MAG: Vacuolar protein sorting-associated protein 4B [Cirrosporium novae-zelandiae]|nr:MAG: Vacuolar protein sorting-associated protein 4B [Cirrosporium novae-zelandiae]